MCKPSVPKPPPVVVRDPVKEAADAANEAAGKANMAIAAKRKLRRESSLLTTGPQGSAMGGSLLGVAKPALAQQSALPTSSSLGKSGAFVVNLARAVIGKR